ncbi:hypothetical protein E3N88_28539 [Mikania micrantha]|uniref:Multifunctional fusion protein n=1 Tax=Mikania micrantha TaxID=192012 RepID=A0A5N6N024_9ASTR|nr:hypothetical protein E3N88_28539 [Mikania micrantha]
MGGGAGISMNAAFRIVTENTTFAMPEASLGSVPDVGSSYFLSRLPGYFGEYVALTGARLNGVEMIECGLATHFVQSKDLASLEHELGTMLPSDAKNITRISEIINKYANKRNITLENANSRFEIIDNCFSRETVEDILLALENIAVDKNEKWILGAIKSMKSTSPLCIKLALKLIRDGRSQKLDQCLVSEYLVVSHLLRRTVNNDFYEGPRAMMIDKDKKPQWSPSKAELVSEEMVSKCFSMIEDEDWLPLLLKSRSNPSYIVFSSVEISPCFVCLNLIEEAKVEFVVDLCAGLSLVRSAYHDEISETVGNDNRFKRLSQQEKKLELKLKSGDSNRETLENERRFERVSQEEKDDGLPPIDLRYGRLTGNILRERHRTQGMSGFEKMADEAWSLGLKAWNEVHEYNEKDTELSSVLEGKHEQCPPWVSINGEELTKGDRIMFLPCGLAAGSSITVVGTPHNAHKESVPQLAKTKGGDPVVLVSQFKVELQGLKSVVAEDPQKILHLNPRLRGDWSHQPVIEHNTCYRMQ